jgi:hypothetical protein
VESLQLRREEARSTLKRRRETLSKSRNDLGRKEGRDLPPLAEDGDWGVHIGCGHAHQWPDVYQEGSNVPGVGEAVASKG